MTPRAQPLICVIPSWAQQQPDVLADLALVNHTQAVLLVHGIDAEAGQQWASIVAQQRGAW